MQMSQDRHEISYILQNINELSVFVFYYKIACKNIIKNIKIKPFSFQIPVSSPLNLTQKFFSHLKSNDVNHLSSISFFIGLFTENLKFYKDFLFITKHSGVY